MAEAELRDKKSTNKNFIDSLIRNSIVVLVCSLGIGVSLWFFRQDLNASLQGLDLKPVGTIYWENNKVKRLSINRLQWDSPQRYSPVYDGDIIATDVLSGVKIKFNNGELLELSESTSVRIAYKAPKTFQFILREGEIQVQNTQNVFTVSLAETAAVEMENSDLKISLSPETSAIIKSQNGYFIKVYQGKGTLTSREGTRTVEKEEALRFGRDGFKREELPVVMLTPGNSTRLLRSTRDKEPVEFRWKRLTGKSTVLEISPARDFSRLEGSWTWDDTDYAKINLEAGSWYWKIYTSSNKEDADSGRLDIIYTEGPQALSPANGSVEVLLSRKQDIRFFWTVPEEAEAVVLEVADNPEMKNPRLQQNIKRTRSGRGSYEYSELKAGQWFWRVSPVFSDLVSLNKPSLVNSFTLVESMESSESSVQIVRNNNTISKPANTALQLIFPPDNYSLEASRTPDLLFTWKNTFSYGVKFQIAERSDFTGYSIKNETVFGSNTQSPFLKPGTYYWRISSTDDRNTSPPHRLVVMPALPGPKLVSPSENERLLVKEGEPTRFSWEPLSYANYYQFSLFLEERELPLSEISHLQNNSVNVYFDPNTAGRFSWTIQGFASPTLDATGRRGLITKGRFSVSPQTTSTTGEISWRIPRITNVQTFAGEVNSPITLISPASGINIPGLQALRFPLEARWRSGEPLRNVQLIVSRMTDPSSDPVAIVKNVSGTSAVFPSLSDGLWYWMIRGDTQDLRGATPGNPFWFNVLPVTLLPAPRSIEPVSGAVIGIEQLTRDRSIRFRWTMVDDANAYIFSIFQDGDPPKLLFSAPPQITFNHLFDNLALLNEGNYLWQVEAVSRNSNGVIEQRGTTIQTPFTIEIQRSDSLQTLNQGVLYGQ